MVRPKIWSKVGKMLERETTLTSHPFMTLKTSQKKRGGLLLINFRIQDSMVIIFSSIIYTSESSTYPAETEIKLSARNQMEYFIVLSQ